MNIVCDIILIDYILESQPTEDIEDKKFVPARTRVCVYEKKGGRSRGNYKDSDQWIEDKYLTEIEVFSPQQLVGGIFYAIFKNSF